LNKELFVMRPHLVYVLLVACGGSSGGDSGGDPDSGTPGGGDASAAEGGTDDATAGDAGSDGASPDAGPAICPAASKYKTALFGNLHQHTMNSLDAFSFGTRARPADAYLFAKGQTQIAIGAATNEPPGPTVKIDRPLDFLAVTDHSEWLGIVAGCNEQASPYYASTECQNVRSQTALDQDATFARMPQLYKTLCGTGSPTAAACAAEQRTAWLDEQTAAAQAYDPCHFTSFVAYEWTSAPGGDTNHRNVFFANDKVPDNPLDSNTYATLGDLFTGLDTQCTGACTALVAPHNSNMSKGTSINLPASPAEAAAMQKYQRLVEIYQHKGSSECFFDPKVPTDPACAFEYLGPGGADDTPKSYVRTSLESGIQYATANGGTNPLQLGIMGSTDDHNGIAGFVKEDSYAGHTGRLDDGPVKRLRHFASYGPGGLAVVWAEENTRESIFAALMRRETYAVSGPRIVLRFYQTTSAEPCTADFPQTIIDANAAVPMGGTFKGQDAPLFAIGAWPDAVPQPLASGTVGAAGLAKVQIIKAHGTTEDPPVDLAVAPTGACITWKDPAFDPKEQAFYYVRVLQVPTWRWSHFDCQTATGVTDCQAGGTLDVTIEERAWSSPIWYVP
jgi:hypothetical protein